MSSTDTFDLSYCLAINAGHYSPLLEISVSVHSLPSVSSADSIPPIPINNNLAHKVHMETYLSLYQSSYLDSPTSPLIDLNENVGIGALLAAPTVPRLRNMVKETLHIKRWLNGLVPNAGFSFRNRRPGETSVWKAEGSLFNPEEYETLRGRRFLSASEDRERTRKSKLRRNALVFERDIKSGSGRGTTISVRLPPTSMHLEQLDPAFNMDSDVKSLQDTPTPRLMVSTSDAIFPISLESYSDVPDKAPQTLAARRGKKTLPQLSLRQCTGGDDYPGIPTAFLGAPSNYLAMDNNRQHHDDAQMDLHSMISTLQSRRVSGPFLPANNTKGDNYSVQDKQHMGHGFDSDRCALPDTAEYGDISLGSSSCPTTASYVVSSTGIAEPDSPDDSSEDLSVSQLADTRRHFCDKPSLQNVIKTPLNDARGGRNKVRFGSLPNRQWESTKLREQLDLDKYIPLVNSTRKVQAPQATACKSVRRPSTVSSGAFVSRPRPPIPFKLTDKGSPSEQRPDLSTRPASTPGNPRSERSSEGSKLVPQRHTIAQQIAARPKAAATPLSRLRTVTNARDLPEKENDKRLSTLPALKTIDENTERRNNSVRQTPSRDASTKKKLQGPFRSIFTRLK
ncbi:hypothetical protein JOM56_007555 [Amanita muscaria]